MPKVVTLTPEQEAWLRANHRLPPARIALQLGVNIDTAKRMLVRRNYAHYPGAKYQLASKTLINLWRRPCMDCGDTKPRPKNHYYCGRCRLSRGYSE